MSGKITGLAALTSLQPDDVLPIVDVHDTTMAPSGTTKKITVASLGVREECNVRASAFAGGADPTGTIDSYPAIHAAMNAAGPIGETVNVPPGNYLTSAPLRWNQLASVSSVLAPSLIGAGSGGNPAFGLASQQGVTRLIPSTSFPVGEPMIDYLGPTASNISMPGFTVEGFIIMGKDGGGTQRAAGLRGFNQWQAVWRDIAVIAPYTGNSSITPGGISANGAVSMYAWNTSNALMNRLEQIWVTDGAYTAFYLQEGPGSYLVADQCMDFGSAKYGFDVGGMTTLRDCVAQYEGNEQFHIQDETGAGGGNVQMIGCQSNGASFNSGIQALVMAGEQYLTLEATGCFFGYCAADAFGDDRSAVLQFSGYPNAVFTGCTIAATSASINKYVALEAGLTAGSLVQFSGCQFTGQYWGHTPAAIYALNGNPGSMLRISGSPLANPFGVQVIAVPATTVATAPLPFDATFYVTANAGAGVTLAISGGPTITVPASAVVPVLVPAGKTLTPTYTSAPTWVVEGN